MLTLTHPEIVIDPTSFEEQPTDYVVHRHDQSIITPLANYLLQQNENIIIEPETSESQHDKAAIVASRKRVAIPPKKSLWKRLKRLIKKILKM